MKTSNTPVVAVVVGALCFGLGWTLSGPADPKSIGSGEWRAHFGGKSGTVYHRGHPFLALNYASDNLKVVQVFTPKGPIVELETDRLNEDEVRLTTQAANGTSKIFKIRLSDNGISEVTE